MLNSVPSRLVLAFIHEKPNATNEDAGADKRAKRTSKSSVALLEDSGKASTHENGWSVDLPVDDLQGDLEKTDKEAEPCEVERLFLEESAVAEEVLLELRSGGSVRVHDSCRLELKATHDESEDEAEAGTGSRNEATLGTHKEGIVGEKLLCEGPVLVKLGLQVGLAVKVERTEVGDAIVVRHSLQLGVLVLRILH